MDGRIAGVMEYNVDLFEAATILRLGEHFKTLLESIVANFEKPVAELYAVEQRGRDATAV